MQKLSVVKVLDREGAGTCQECGKEGLRWIAELSDGSTVGVECAKKLTGRAVSVKSISWVAGTTEVASGSDCGATWTLYANGTRGFLALDGRLSMTGSLASVAAEFARRVA